MIKNKFKILIFISLICVMYFVFISSIVKGAETKNDDTVKLGAYYFDGWTGTYPSHITSDLVNKFPEREPKWGWITSTQDIMNDQIKLAANAGLSFFSFCWYFNGVNKYKREPLNQSLGFYLKSPNNSKLQYTLMVANHNGFMIGPDDWEVVCKEWIGKFKSDLYLKVDGKPLITFFSISTLLEKFQTTEGVKKALNQLRAQSIKEGMQGVSIAVTLAPNKKEILLAEACGFDILSGYNYHTAGFVGNNKQIPIESMQKEEGLIWNQFSTLSTLPYIPVTTINWDPRPWATAKNNYSTSSYFVGFSEKSVFNSVDACKKWIIANSNNTVKDKIGLIYAWNEYGEGAYLTPTKKGQNPLKGVSKSLK